ncbi:MAG: choice-of-anchor D domain-containing protein, partial [Gammaproteobacteria bacterium]|nr:choice-of-anchor D domain-containing protein [Gammaproteobacteria bacterium]
MKAYRYHFFALVLLWLLSPTSVFAAVCDTDEDGDVDHNDIFQIALARNAPATGPDDPADADGDGFITVLDARTCILRCTLPRCTVIDPPVDVPTIDVSPDPLSFGDVLVGNSANLALVVSNTGTATLSVSTITSSGAPFSVTPPTSFDITAGGAAQNVQINFSPAAPGVFNGTVTINSNADNIDPVVIAVTGRGVEPQVNVPTIDVGPDPLDFGDVLVGSSANLPLTVENTGDATLSVSNIASSGAPFSVFPPVSFDIADGGSPRNVDIDFSPAAEGIFNGTITINSNADNIDPALVAVTGRGVLPPPAAEPDIDSATSLLFGAVPEGASVEQQLTISNLGDAPLNVSDVTSDNSDFAVAPLPGQNIPFTLDPGGSQNVAVTFTAPAGSAGTTITGELSINSDDPDESPRTVSLAANVIPVVTLVNIPILGASVDGVIGAGNCANVSGSVQFGDTNVFLFSVTLTDQGGASATSSLFSSASGAAVAFSGIDACALDDGILQLSVSLGSFAPFVGTPAIKNTSLLPPPVLDPVAAASVAQSIQICGTSRESTTVKIEGGASTVSTQVAAGDTAFCLDVPLRRNTENTLIATAIDNLAAPPRPRASANPIQVTHVDPSSIIIAEASSRPLTIEETELLVENGVIDLDDPGNFNVSMFTIVLTIGQFPVTISQPVAVPAAPSVSYGSGGGGWTGGGGGGGGVSAPRPVTGCISGCSNIVVIKTPSGQTIPGVIIIDGRIKTLKEFFQVTIAIQNTSTDFVLADMAANIVLPAGLSPVKAGPGTDVSTINTGSAIDSVDIGDIGPTETGTGQFIIRGDGIGTHNVDVDFNGFLTGGGLAQPEPVSGSAGTSVQVFGPPTFDVVVRHPSRVGLPDVTFNEIYDLIVEITNTSNRPALYTSLELFVGGDSLLVDGAGNPIPGSNQIISFGQIPSGRAVQAAFRVQSKVEGEIIACQAIASENINLAVDTGPDGTDCNIANTYPANFEPLPADQPPVVIGINPLNGQPNIPVTTSVLATLTPQSSNCIVGDTFTNVVETLIDPSDPSKGIQVISADLVQAGTFYLEELDTFGNPVKHIPTDLTVENPPAGGTTIAVLRLGLDTPHNNSQYFLRDNTTYRATLVGGAGGICSDASGAEMVEGFTWTFSTEQTCSGIGAPIATMSAPPNGSIDRPLNQSIVLNFTNRMNPGSFAFVPGDLANSSFSVYQDAIEAGGEISGGTAVPGTAVFSNLFRTLTYKPAGNLPEDVPVYIRLTDGLRDVCGNPLQTPPAGVQLLSFQTIP